jgi:thioester reductase-like protein
MGHQVRDVQHVLEGFDYPGTPTDLAEHALGNDAADDLVSTLKGRYRGQVNVTDMFTRLILSLVTTGIAPSSSYQLDAGGNPQRAHYEVLPADFTAEAITSLGTEIAEGFSTFNVLNTNDDDTSLDTFVDWLIADGKDIRRVDLYDDWLGEFERALKALPDEQRKHSLVPLLNAYARSASPSEGLRMPAENFSAAVQSARVGDTDDVPHLSEPLFDKYPHRSTTSRPAGSRRCGGFCTRVRAAPILDAAA